MAQIVDTGRSLTSSGGQTINFPIVASPNVTKLAEFGLFTTTSGVAHLNVSVNFTVTLGIPSIVFMILRNGQQVFNFTTSGLAAGAVIPISFSFLEKPVPQGYHAYTLTVTNNSLNTVVNLAAVTGPILFSGISIG